MQEVLASCYRGEETSQGGKGKASNGTHGVSELLISDRAGAKGHKRSQTVQFKIKNKD